MSISALYEQCQEANKNYFITRLNNYFDHFNIREILAPSSNMLMRVHFDGLVQERRHSIANALESRLSYTNPSIWQYILGFGNALHCFHYNYVIMARWRLKSPASSLFTQPFIQEQIKENIQAPRHWPLCGEYTGDQCIPHTNGQ